MRRRLLFCLGVLVVAFAVWVIAFMAHVQWVGGYDLIVRFIRQPASSSVRVLRYATLMNREDAERVVSRLPKAEKAVEWRAELRPIHDPATGLSVPCELRIFAYGSTSMIGTDRGTFRERFLVAVADLDDGRQVGVITELPHTKHVGEVIVVLP